MSGINTGIGLSVGTVTGPTVSGLSGGSASDKSQTNDNKAVDDFLAYMKKSLAERMADAWLQAHGLDREKLKAMPADQREAVLKQMAKELKDQIAQAADEQAKKNARAGISGSNAA